MNLTTYRLNYSAETIPVSFENQSQISSLPMYPELSDDVIERVVNVIKLFYCVNREDVSFGVLDYKS
jgi:hypothetical protein